IASHSSPNVDFGHTFSARYVHRVRAVPGVKRADNLIVYYLPVVQPSGAVVTTIVYAMKNFSAWGLPWDVRQGNLDDLRRGSNIFIDESAGRTFDPFALGEYRETQGYRLQIVGTTKGAVSFTTYPMMFLDISTMRSVLPDLTEGQTTFVLVELEPDADVEQTREILRQRLPHHDVWTKAEWRQMSREYWIVTTGLGFNIFVTAALGCLVGLVIVAQTLYASTLEHVHEYATFKAIGGNNKSIYWMLTKQAFICAVLGFLMGLCPVLAMQAWVPKLGLSLVTPAWLVASVFGGAVLLCLASATASFRTIATVDPALVFRG
ncbi:MAG TPA: ABC transporter permease, partial [Polyangiaceae bacterium]|nr:ABC transporter permease [Polyangiaceae bacterium]